MSVSPGFGKQAFEAVALDKLCELKALVPESVTLEVDGGVNPETIGACAAAGSQWHVVGSAIFGHADYSKTIAELVGLAKSQSRTH